MKGDTRSLDYSSYTQLYCSNSIFFSIIPMYLHLWGVKSKTWKFRPCGLGFWAQDLGFRVQGLGFRVWGSGFGVYGLGFRV